ncbi:MAG: FecR domain-containing protein [Chloroflexi bacterium]|nr:FecR domain-containing protein [Chloroflexota bacterium]
MRSNIGRTAWIILLAAFGIFCLLSLLIPASIRWYIINATVNFTTEVTSVRGTVVIGDPTTGASSSLTDGNTTSVEENFMVSTDSTSQAILTFSDDSSLTMYSDTAIILRETRSPRFGLSSNPTKILVEVQKGRVRATSSLSREDLSFDVDTPHAQVELSEGSFSIEVNETETQVTTRLGQADVIGGGQLVMLKQGERAIVGLDETPSPPLPAAQNLLKDSEFSPASLNKSWKTYAINFSTGVITTAEVVTFQDRSVLGLRSEGEDNVHTEVGVTQEVNKDVRDFQSLRIFAEVRLVRQSLPGGGQAGSEFPIMLRLDYKDADNNDRQWYHGFYYAPKPDNYILYNEPQNSSERIARFIWYPYESENLLTSLGPAKPVFIKSIRIYASGWIYEAMVANVSLLAQE